MENQTSPQKIKSPVPSPVPVNEAAGQTYNWRNFMTTVTDYDTVNGYFIPKDDILAVLDNATNGIRVYFALPDADAEPTPGVIHSVHLYVVAVDGSGNDVIHDPEAIANSAIYDTTVPCPTVCGTPNALNGLLSMP